MKNIQYLFISILIISLSACQKEITLDFSANHSNTVFIEGMLYVGQKSQVFISKSNPFFSPKVTPQQIFARGAVVTITSGLLVDILVADSTDRKSVV